MRIANMNKPVLIVNFVNDIVCKNETSISLLSSSKELGRAIIPFRITFILNTIQDETDTREVHNL